MRSKNLQDLNAADKAALLKAIAGSLVQDANRALSIKNLFEVGALGSAIPDAFNQRNQNAGNGFEGVTYSLGVHLGLIVLRMLDSADITTASIPTARTLLHDVDVQSFLCKERRNWYLNSFKESHSEPARFDLEKAAGDAETQYSRQLAKTVAGLDRLGGQHFESRLRNVRNELWAHSYSGVGKVKKRSKPATWGDAIELLEKIIPQVNALSEQVLNECADLIEMDYYHRRDALVFWKDAAGLKHLPEAER